MLFEEALAEMRKGRVGIVDAKKFRISHSSLEMLCSDHKWRRTYLTQEEIFGDWSLEPEPPKPGRRFTAKYGVNLVSGCFFHSDTDESCYVVRLPVGTVVFARACDLNDIEWLDPE